MLREITTHKGPGANDLIRVEAADEPGPGGASCKFQFWVKKNGQWEKAGRLEFQKGPVDPTGGLNGATNEAVLAVLIDRLRSWQDGPFPCRQNAIAITKLEEALHWLQDRTRERIERGVENQEKK